MAKFNRNFGRINESGGLEFAPLPLIVDGLNVWTNIPGTYIKEGYYPVVNTDMPIKEGCYYSSYYEQEGDLIVQRWEEHEIAEGSG